LHSAAGAVGGAQKHDVTQGVKILSVLAVILLKITAL